MEQEKMCSFYVSDFHLISILMPYINEKILEQKEIITFLQNDISKDVRKFLKSVKNLNFETEKIMNVNWNIGDKSEFTKIDREKVILVAGDEDYINEISSILENEKKYGELVNCYKIENLDRIDIIASGYDIFLNTSGKNDIRKISQNEQENKTIKTQI